jgi:hypothetical protein
MSSVITTITPRPATKLGDVNTFPFGAVIRPDSDLIGGYHEESGRSQICIPKDHWESLRDLNIDYEPWKIGLWVSHRPKRPSEFTRVVTTRYGYRALHYDRLEGSRILGHTFAGVPIVFPTAEDAILATEAKLQGAPESGVYEWLHPSSGLRPTTH